MEDLTTLRSEKGTHTELISFYIPSGYDRNKALI